MIEKSVFRKSLNPKMRPQSFPDPVLGLAVFFSKPEVKFHGFGTSKHGEGKSLSKLSLLFLSVHCGEFIEQTKTSVIHTLSSQ